MAGWNNEQIEDLLEHYEDEHVLWKVTHKNYHKKEDYSYLYCPDTNMFGMHSHNLTQLLYGSYSNIS